MKHWIPDVDDMMEITIQNNDINNNSNIILNINNLSVDFNTLAGSVNVVRDINFCIRAGETMALVGESGSGKSVTAMSILRLHDEEKVNYSSGSILFNGDNILGSDERHLNKVRGRDISMIFQEPMTSMNPTFTVGDQIMEPLLIHKGLNKHVAKQRVLELMELTGIPEPQHRFDSYPHLLSGGQRQRMMIAMALACEPKLLIADEPTTALDVTVQLQILLLLEKLQKEFSMAVLMISHDLNLVKRFADHICVMKNGNIVETNESQQLFEKPQHPYTIELLNSEPERMISDDNIATHLDQELLNASHLQCYFSIKSGFFRRTTQTIKAVDNIHLYLKEGETLGIVGESGSGKSTLGRCLLRLENCQGEIQFNQQRIDQLSYKHLRPLRKEFQVVFQDPYSSLSPRMTIEQIVGEGLQIHFPHLNKQQRREKIQKTLIEVGLEDDILWRYPHEFSGGQRQRIAIARVVILEPKLILLDEPTSALDISVQKQVLGLLRDLQLRYKMSYLFITHDLKVIQAVAHRVMVMKEGRIVETGLTTDVFNHPKEKYTRSLLTASLFKKTDQS